MSHQVDRRRFIVSLGGAALSAGIHPAVRAASAAAPVEMQTIKYASPGGHDLVLDLYRPTPTQGRLPVIVFLHGGGWVTGTRITGPDFKRFFAQDGFAMASIDYRLTPSVTFPANVEDVKTAIRWLKANADSYGLDARRIGLWGTSAGGHLAAVAGLAPSGSFEGDGHLDQSSRVQCVLDAYGPTVFNLMDAQTAQEKATLQAPHPALANRPPPTPGVAPRGPDARQGALPVHDDPASPESRLVGAPIQTVPDRVKAASPLTYVSKEAPPFLIMHGMADSSVPYHQSIALYEALAAAGTAATLRLIDGLPHTFFNYSDLDEIAAPFRMQVRQSMNEREKRHEERAGVFEVARRFFTAHLM